VALNEPGAAVAVDEAGQGLAELLHGVVQPDPHALLRSASLSWQSSGESYGRNLWMSLWHESAAYLPP
jgi:hypothetical protein